MLHAVIENNQVVRFGDWTPPIQCKMVGGLPVARPVEGDPPPFNAALEQLAGPTYQIEPTKVVRKWTVERRPLDAQKAAVKAEAQRRIIALTGKETLQDCMIKQFNALMRAGQLTDKKVNGGAWTAEEEAEATTLRTLADKVKAMRAASDVIEAMSPIPLDYTDNKHWPA